MSRGYMYILLCSNGSYYTGSTKYLELRLSQHQAGEGANHTKKHLPVKLVYYEEFERIDEAFYREKQVQGWSRKKKEALINGDFDKLSLLSRNYTQYGDVDADSANSATGVKSEVSEPAINEVSERTKNEVSERTKNEVSERTKNEVSERTKNEASERTKNEVSEHTKNEASERTKNEASERTKNEASEHTKNEASEPVEDPVKQSKDLEKAIMNNLKGLGYE